MPSIFHVPIFIFCCGEISFLCFKWYGLFRDILISISGCVRAISENAAQYGETPMHRRISYSAEFLPLFFPLPLDFCRTADALS